MDTVVAAEVFLFEAFRFDRRAGALFRRDEGGAPVPVAIGSRALAVLGVLMARHGELVSKEEIMQAVWPGTVVEDNNLTVQISALRRVLDKGRAEGSCIQTIARRGYRFVGRVTREAGGPRPRLSIVVLPFTNLSEDREQQYFADGITDDVTTDLSRLADMFVISRNTAFTYRNQSLDTKQIGRELDVRYVLEGSVRRSGTRVRINAQLVDAETDAHLWAEQFDSDTVDLFALQNEITSRISVALGSELVIAAAAQPSGQPDALDYIFRGRAALSKPPTRDNYAEAIGLFERALAVDPGSVEAGSWLAIAFARRKLDHMNDSAASGAADIARAAELVGQALAISPSSPRAHFAKGDLLCAQLQFAEAIPEFESVLASNRNSVDALAIIGRCKIFIGMIDEAIPLVEQALRLSPRDRWTGVWCSWIGQAHLLQSRTDEAILCLEKGRSANPALPIVRLYLAAAYALKGESERAAAELGEARRLGGADRFSSIASTKAVGFFGVPKVHALYEATVFAGLRKAGMPEE
jgi:TolB-like protein